MSQFFLVAGSVSGFLSVALGAFGAHALKERLDAYHLGVFQTGVHYQFFHCFAMLVIGILLMPGDRPALRAAGYAFLAGSVVFSGSLYLLALTQVKMWGAVTPLGGVGFLIGWGLMTVAFLKW